ncbi:MAG: hypothetical protein ACREGR_03575 [Minisyncoccia bacterium]
MPRAALFEWEGREYEHNPKNADWYWALGIIAAAFTLAAILFGQVLLAVLILAAAVAIGLHAAKEPSVHTFRILDSGLAIGSDLYRYERMRSFAMLEHIEGEEPPLLSIKTESWFTPHLVIPLAGVDADALYAYLLERVEEAEHPHTIVDLVAAWMGF